MDIFWRTPAHREFQKTNLKIECKAHECEPERNTTIPAATGQNHKRPIFVVDYLLRVKNGQNVFQ